MVMASQLPTESLSYDVARLLFSGALDIFFREVKERGAHKIPKEGPVIFVCAPHANQFVDPLILIKHAGRQVGFLAAKKSMDKFWIGLFARSVGSIPVVRPQDLTKRGKGKVYLADATTNLDILKGIDTDFTRELKPRTSISVAGISVEVLEVISGTDVKLKTPIASSSAIATLTAKPADGESIAGSSFKYTPHVDQADMFHTVTARLKAGGCVGIFPEGGSHDRSEFLPLKPGVAMMALGAMAEHDNLDVKIIPCGLNYFHAHKFRSRAVIEFGDPIDVSGELVENYRKGGAERRAAVSDLLETIFKSLKSVAVTAPDYETLMVIQALRRLYRPIQSKLSIDQTLVVTRRFAEGFEKYRKEPAVQQLFIHVQEYNKLLAYYGIRDHQVMKTSFGGITALIKLLTRIVEIFILFALATPGVILHMPIMYMSRQISHQKAREAKRDSSVKLEGRDVVATWKILVALVVTPACYFSYTLIFYLYLLIFTDYSSRLRTILSLLFCVICPTFGWAALKTSEIGFDILRSLRPLFLAIFPSSTEHLRLMRSDLTSRLNAIIDDFGPGLFGGDRDLFDAVRIVKPEDVTYSEILAKKINKKKKDDLHWEHVDASEIDDVFLFKDDRGRRTDGYSSDTSASSPIRKKK